MDLLGGDSGRRRRLRGHRHRLLLHRVRPRRLTLPLLLPLSVVYGVGEEERGLTLEGLGTAMERTFAPSNLQNGSGRRGV